VLTVYLPNSDATLFGLLVQVSTLASVKEAGKVAVSALKAAAHGIKEEELKYVFASILQSFTNHSMLIPRFSQPKLLLIVL
jgi:hypothetical protein